MVLLTLRPPYRTIEVSRDEMLGYVFAAFRPVFGHLATHSAMKHRIVALHWSAEVTPLHGEVLAAKIVAFCSHQPCLATHTHRRVFGSRKMNMV
jgi:hypothetical protein